LLGKSTRSLLILVIDKIQKLNPETSLAESGVASIPPRASRILILFCLSTSFLGLGFQRTSPESISHSPRIRTRDNGLSDTRLAVVPTSRPINYIVIVVMENRNYADIIGNPSTPYTNRLANDYGVPRTTMTLAAILAFQTIWPLSLVIRMILGHFAMLRRTPVEVGVQFRTPPSRIGLKQLA